MAAGSTDLSIQRPPDNCKSAGLLWLLQIDLDRLPWMSWRHIQINLHVSTTILEKTYSRLYAFPTLLSKVIKCIYSTEPPDFTFNTPLSQGVLGSCDFADYSDTPYMNTIVREGMSIQCDLVQVCAPSGPCLEQCNLCLLARLREHFLMNFMQQESYRS